MKTTGNSTKKIMLLISFTVLLLVVCWNYEKVFKVIATGLGLLSPFILGGCLAFLLNVPMSFIERHLFPASLLQKHPKMKGLARMASLLLSIAVVAGVVVAVVFLVVPEIGKSLQMLGEMLPQFWDEVQGLLKDLGNRFPEAQTQVLQWEADLAKINWKSIGNSILNFLQNGGGDLLNSTISFATSIINGFVNFFIGFCFAIYILSSKEKLGRQTRKLLYACLPEKKADVVLRVSSLSYHTFANFVSGQCTEAVILGAMFFISMTIFRFQYAMLISTMVTVTALIPMIGAMIANIVGTFLIFIVDPIQALWYIVLFVTLQQIEGNLIYPHVVGNSVGLPSIWVLVAVTVGGSAGGVVGMIVNIPLCSVLYALLRTAVNTRLVTEQVPVSKWIETPAELSAAKRHRHRHMPKPAKRKKEGSVLMPQKKSGQTAAASQNKDKTADTKQEK